MNVHLSYKASKTPEVEREFQHQIEKLQKRLHVFKPDLIHLHAIIEPVNGRRASRGSRRNPRRSYNGKARSRRT